MNRYLDLASGPTQTHAYRQGPRVTSLETAIPHDVMPGLMALRIHTDAGAVAGVPVIGHGETYYIPTAAAAVIHDFFSPRLLGSDVSAIESHWRFLYERITAFGGVGAELRALSAVDLALWDIAGQLAERPIWRLLGGPVRDAVPVYNSCGGPFYGRSNRRTPAASGWPGHGDPGQPGPLEDNWASSNQPGDLAEELIALGYRGMKLWSFDGVYRRQGGHYLTQHDIDEGLRPFRQIRERVGDNIELMLDGHGFFSLAAARQIATAMQEVRPLWLEDVLRPDSIATMAAFRAHSPVPIAVSEMLTMADGYRQVLESAAADYIMIDPTWVGGISATRRIAELAQVHNVPTLMHDCTGPMTLLAGIQIAASNTGVAFQETVRAHLTTLYPLLIDRPLSITAGEFALPQASGLGARWQEPLFDPAHPGYRISSI
ncbi:MAG: mandelate racemase/muconate lactonizing enzyme family protein [Planctomycetaceae bacterium]|nr:MAG: mandelate racemase/muconate lactonizing enzyme family protein [Planctomycetaceae bacterium]